MTRATGLYSPLLAPAQVTTEALGFARKFVRAIVNRLAVYELTSYDERLLKDIGLTRSDVVAALDVSLMDDPSIHLRKLSRGYGRL